MYKPNLSRKIIIKEYLNVSNFFLNISQTKYLNAILDNLSKKINKMNEIEIINNLRKIINNPISFNLNDDVFFDKKKSG